jgi:glycosyltransferase involved in cell wall biosynthesis
MSVPSVSILMSAYNAERYVEMTVRSVLAQTFGDFEMVVVDDGSTDRTPQILAGFAEQDPRVRLIQIENAGISKANNIGLEACRADWVARIDADDLAKPRRLEVQYPYVREHDLVACGTWHDLIDEVGRFLRVQQTPVDDEAIQRAALRGHGAICNPTSIFHRKTFLDLGGYSEDLISAEDLDCWLRLGEVGPLGNVPQSLGAYRLHSGSISERQCRAQRAFAKEACERAWRRRGITGTFEASDMWRPGRDRTSRHKFAVEYGWWAFTSGEARTAVAYAKRAVLLKPWDMTGYKLLGATLLRGSGGRPA